MENKSIEIIDSVIAVTKDIINLIGAENDAISSRQFKMLKPILAEKHNLMRSYEINSLELAEVIEELKQIEKAKVNDLFALTEKLNEVCDINTKLLSKEQDIALNIISIMKEVAEESSSSETSGFISIKA